MVAELGPGGSGSLETPADAGKGDAGIVKRWNMEWELATKAEEGWRKRARKAIDRFRDDTDLDSGSAEQTKRQRFNILYSNVQTLAPCLYNSKPNPDVRRRFRDADPLGKQVADILERSLSYSNDMEDFDAVMQTAVIDYLLPGRAVTRVRYMPTFRTVTPGEEAEMEGTSSERSAPDIGTGRALQPEGGEQTAGPSEADAPDDDESYEELTFEECICEPVQWDLFRHGPGKRWGEVPWVGFEHHLTRKEAVDKFGDVAKDIDLDFVPENIDGDKADKDPDTFKRMTVREIWDRDERRVLFIAPKYGEAPLRVEQDPLNLEGFFPMPRPLYAVEATDTLIPIEEYRMYEPQARELDRITQRINRIINGLKLRGVYDSSIAEIEQVFRSDDNAMIPATNVPALQGKGLESAIWMLPINQAAQVLVELYNQRDRIIQSIYQITGIGDIMRAQTDPRETLGAQRLKSGWGTMRLQKRQREIQRYARDLIRIKAEIIANHFSMETLRLMTGVQMMTGEEKQAKIQALTAQAEQIIQQRAQAAAAQAAQQALAQPAGVSPMPASNSAAPMPSAPQPQPALQ